MQDLRWCIVFGLACLFGHVSAAYSPIREHAGATFFDRWAYYGNVDNTTWGNVTFQDKENATSRGLTFINGAGNAVIKVDNTTTILPAPLVNRDSIRLTSLDSYGVGSLIIIDAVHIPYGCSVWPSFWTYGIEEEWPAAGEIDIIEAINDMNHNQVALHTNRSAGCFQSPNVTQSGTTLEKDCGTDQGCIVAENKPNSFGPGFAQAGGGVYAVQIESSGINSWFFGRAELPDNLKSATSSSAMDISTWGLPTAAYPTAGCNIDHFFPPQNLVLLTTLCGVWAGVPSIYSSTCHTPTNSCVNDNIIGSGANYANAYWEIRYIRAYQSDTAAASLVPSSALPSPPSPTNSNVVVVVTTSTIVTPPSPSPTTTSSAALLHPQASFGILTFVFLLFTTALML
ncbi:hypothetical protein GALMADRAFT_237298 [Galerina marginata CBS 339.88]|uniref:GH16 domain-containing protein n=1 Tax=Galerina marginata (strain CBS 339.88) TaxID=685588 RepID=A0A067TQ75_GALM3|nr:hypothetical protein GALMADRAFT_237298 [Galerina marginata CBS 339.88]